MKNFLWIFLTLLMTFTTATGLAEVNDVIFSFSTTGIDTYSDGSRVENNECYSLVWVSDGHSFSGFQRDGKLVDETFNKVVLVAPSAKNGRCSRTVVQIAASYAETLKNGKFFVVLLDTRVRKLDGSYELAEFDDNNHPMSVSASSVISENISIEDMLMIIDEQFSTVLVAAVPSDSKVPRITNFTMDDGDVRLEVAEIEAYNKYNVLTGTTVTNITENVFAYEFNGELDSRGKMTIAFQVNREDRSRFFKLVRR